MSKLLDPHRCPDCRELLDPGNTCTGCGLALTGPLAHRLWQTMTTADSLVEAIRRAPALPPAPPVAPPLPPLPTATPRHAVADAPEPGLRPTSVPTVLFVTGAICLLVAAVVFVAVAWGSLGLGARTAILLAVTGAFAGLATRFTRRGLRGGAETFWLVTALLVAIDLGAAYTAGLLAYDTLDPRHAVAVLGAAVGGVGLAGATIARRGVLRTLASATIASTIGVLLVTASLAWTGPQRALVHLAAVLAVAGLAVALRRLELRAAAAGAWGVAVLSWLVLLLHGLLVPVRPTPGEWWAGAQCWPVLAAAGLAGVVALPGRREDLRIAGATTAVMTTCLAVLVPAWTPDQFVTVSALMVAVLTLATPVLPRVWALPTNVLAVAGALLAAGFLLVRPLPLLDGLPFSGGQDVGVDRALEPAMIELAGWTAVVVALVVVLAGAVAVRVHVPEVHRATVRRTWSVLAPVLVAIGLATAVTETGPTLLVAVLVWCATLGLLAVLAAALRGAVGPAVLLLAGYLGVLTLAFAQPSSLLVAAVASALALGLVVALRITLAPVAERAAIVAGAAVAGLLAAARWPTALGGDGDAVGITLVLVAAALGLAAAWVTDSEAERVVLEVIAAGGALVAVAFPADPVLAVGVLTAAGTTIALVGVLHPDREVAGWLGAVTLGAAAVGRVDLGLELPELATAPAAALLLAAGVRRLLVDPAVPSLRALGSGLTLALLPSLLLALDEPTSPRALAIGLVAVAFLAVGISRRWAAPFLAGNAALALLALRNLGPIADAVPRWISLGLIGVALLAVAVTWESRRKDMRAAERYLVALR